MAYRKGELTDSAIDRGWPHQVALTVDHVSTHYHTVIRL